MLFDSQNMQLQILLSKLAVSSCQLQIHSTEIVAEMVSVFVHFVHLLENKSNFSNKKPCIINTKSCINEKLDGT